MEALNHAIIEIPGLVFFVGSTSAFTLVLDFDHYRDRPATTCFA